MSSKPTANGTYFMVESGSWVPPVYFRAALGNLGIPNNNTGSRKQNTTSVQGAGKDYGEIREKKTRFEIPRILAKYRRLAMHVKEMQPSVSVLDATDRERTQRIVASFIINLFKSLSESAQDFDSQQPFTRSPPFAPPLIRCARQGQAAAAARRLCAHVALVRSLT